MKVQAVTPSDVASHPSHPDHDRWVKEKTLRMEIEHARVLGIPLRIAEAENVRMLERSERIAKETPQKLTKKRKPHGVLDAQGRTSRQQRNRERGVIVKPATPEVKPVKLSPCGRCQKCLACRREQRAMLIIHRRKENRGLDMLALRMFVTALHSKAGSGKFKGLSKRDTDRAVSADVETICDESVRWLGAWR